MAELLLSTTGTSSPVIITDLGDRTFVHPVTNLDLLLEYKHSEIIGSSDLNIAVAAGFITLTDADGVLFPIVQDLAPIKNNFDTGAPTVTDDIDAGYSKNSLWIKTVAPLAFFVCLDNAAGAADWAEIPVGDAANALPLQFSFTSAGGDYVEATGQLYEVLASYEYPGTDIATPNSASFVLSRSSGTGTSDVRIFDFTNGLEIALVNYAPNGKATYVDVSLTNLPSAGAIFEIQARKTAGPDGKPRVHFHKLS